MTKRVLQRLLETFFRRWWLYLIPLVLFTGVGVYSAMGSGTGYRSVGVVDLSRDTLVQELTELRGEVYGYDSPATTTTRTLNSLLGTATFLGNVAERAGVLPDLESGLLDRTELRSWITTQADGDTLMQVAAITEDPDLSARVAEGVIESYVDYEVQGDIAESTAAEAFFDRQVETYQTELDAAQQELAEYAVANPSLVDERPLDQQVQVDLLQNRVDLAETKVAGAQQQRDDSRLATEQAELDARQQFRMVDVPAAPEAPEPRLRKSVIVVALFFVVGLIMSVVAVVLGSVVDRSFRSSDEVEHLLDIPVLTVVPAVRGVAASRR